MLKLVTELCLKCFKFLKIKFESELSDAQIEMNEDNPLSHISACEASLSAEIQDRELAEYPA